MHNLIDIATRITTLLLLCSITLNACEELERSIRKDFGTSGVQLFQQLAKKVTQEDPKAEFTFAQRLLTIKHSRPCADTDRLTQSHEDWRLVLHSSPDAHTTIMRFACIIPVLITQRDGQVNFLR
jgi:hypothetical protein